MLFRSVGFKEVHPLSFGGEVFTVGLIISGVGTAFYAATLVATMMVEGGLHGQLARRRFTRMLENIQNHFILCGYGRIGSIIAEDLARQGVPFIVIERDAERIMSVMERGWLGLSADASREDVLRKAGIDRARGLIAALDAGLSHDQAVWGTYFILSALFFLLGTFLMRKRFKEDDPT